MLSVLNFVIKIQLVFIFILLQSFSIHASEGSEVFSQIANAIKSDFKDIISDSNSGFLEKKSDKFEIKISKNLTNVNYLLKKAKAAFDIGSIEIAASFYKQILSKFPDNKSALIGLGNLYYVQKDYELAHTIYLSLLKKYPKDTTIILNYLTIVSDYDPDFTLKEMLNLSNNVNKTYAPLHAHLSLLYAKLNDVNSAKNYMISALSLEPDNVFYIYNLAVMYDKLSEFKNAAFFYKKLINKITISQDKNTIKNIPIKQVSNRLKFIKSVYNLTYLSLSPSLYRF